MLLVADNLTITNETVEKALADMDPEPIKRLAADCEAAGARAIDINPGPLSRNPELKMRFFVQAVEAATDLPLLIDTANPAAMAAGLSACTKTPVINGFSLEKAKLEKILPLAGQFDADIIGYLIYPDSRVPSNADERLAIALEIWEHARKAGIDPSRLIMDPVIVPLSWDNGKFQAREVLSVIRRLPELLGHPVRTIAGISNLTAGRGNRKEKAVFERIYLTLLAEAGLDMALLNVFHGESMETAGFCERLLNNKVFTWT